MIIASALLYASVMAMSVLLGYYASETNKKFYIVFIILLLSVLSGLRGESVGLDTVSYNQMFDLLKKGESLQYYVIEDTFRFIAQILLKIFHHNNWLFFLFALLSHGLIVFRFWDFRENSSFGIQIFCYYCGFYFFSLNVMRQFCAVAFVFFGTRFLPKGGYFKFLLFLLVGVLFHKSALLGLGYVFCDFFLWKHLKDNRKLFLCCSALVCVIGAFLALPILEEYITRYWSTMHIDIGLMLFAKLGFFVITVILLNKKQRHLYKENASSIDNYQLSALQIYYLIGILLTSLGYIFLYAERVGLYFFIFESVYMGMLVKNLNQKIFKIKIFDLGVILLASYTFLEALWGNGQGQMPYRFFWQ